MSGILALDLATVAGYAAGPAGAVPACGSDRLAPSGAGVGRFLSAAERWLDGLFSLHQPELVIFETAFIRHGEKGQPMTSIATARKLQSLAGLAEKIAWERRLPDERVCEADSSTVCKQFTGRGRFPGGREQKKAAVIGRCRALGWEPTDDNAADALALWWFAERQFFKTSAETRALRARGSLALAAQ